MITEYYKLAGIDKVAVLFSVTVKVVQMAVLMVVLKTVQTVNLIGRHTDLNAAIRHGVSLVLTARP